MKQIVENASSESVPLTTVEIWVYTRYSITRVMVVCRANSSRCLCSDAGMTTRRFERQDRILNEETRRRTIRAHGGSRGTQATARNGKKHRKADRCRRPVVGFGFVMNEWRCSARMKRRRSAAYVNSQECETQAALDTIASLLPNIGPPRQNTRSDAFDTSLKVGPTLEINLVAWVLT